MKDRDVVFLMVDGVDAAEKVASYLKDGRYTMPVAFKSGAGNPMQAYGVTGCPTQFVIGRDGTIRSRGIAATTVEIRRMIESALAK